VFSSIDEQGRYAYRNQPWIAQWNLARLAETLLPLIDDDPEKAIPPATALLESYPAVYEAEWLAVMRRKLGLEAERDGDRELAEDLLAAMHAGRADFTLAFRRLADAVAPGEGEAALLALCQAPEGIAAWLPRWRERLAGQGTPDEIAARLRAVNPLYIPRNHKVEEALAAAAEHDDFAPFEALAEVLADPFTERPGLEAYARPAPPTERVFRTFCGT
jgi:serine/tyrosine/threonine adenylyltransferase